MSAQEGADSNLYAVSASQVHVCQSKPRANSDLRTSMPARRVSDAGARAQSLRRLRASSSSLLVVVLVPSRVHGLARFSGHRTPPSVCVCVTKQRRIQITYS